MIIPEVFRKATESLFDCVADVYHITESEDDFDGFDDEAPNKGFAILHSAMPCRISTKSLGPVSSKEGVSPAVSYELRLFCSFDYEIPPGCRFVVTDRNGRSKEYLNSGDPFTNYQTHQAISIERTKFI